MKAVVLHQPYATLVALGVKTIETRPSPPNGPMRPAGVRGLPGLPIAAGERIAIVAGAKRPTEERTVEVVELWCNATGRGFAAGLIDVFGGHGYSIPYGAVVCTVVVAEALPMTLECGDAPHIAIWEGTESRPDGWVPSICRDGGDDHTELDIDAPLGDYRDGRWGWMLADVEPCAPVPVKGRQGVFALPDDVAAQIGTP